MKKLLTGLLALVLLLALSTTAFAAKPGDTVTITVSVNANPNAAFTSLVGFNFNTSVLEFVSATASSGDTVQVPTTASGSFLLYNLSGISTGAKGSITFKVKAGASAGTYPVSVYAYDCIDVNENEVSMSVSGGSVTVEGTACTEHSWNAGTVTTKATCISTGVMKYACTVCGETKEETIPVTDHTEGAAVVTKAATCTEAGEQIIPCATCNETLKTEPVDALGHAKGNAVITKEATCTEAGSQSYKCTVCGVEIENEEIAALGHKEGEATITKEPTCTEAGEQVYKCTVCGETLKTEEVAALGHKEGEATVTKAATCTEVGEQVYKCTVCGEVLKTEEIAALGHKEGEATITKEPTCTEAGEQVYKCTVCGETLKTEEIAAEGHDEKWVTVEKATTEKEGLKELQCTKCGEILDTEIIPIVTAVYYMNNTASSMGPCFRDETDLTDKWYRFTPIDVSVDGTKTYSLIASNLYIIGQVTVTVAEGNVTVDCTYASENIDVISEFCTFLPSLAEIETLEPEMLKNYAFGEPVSIENDLAGDTKVLLFIRNVVNYNTDMPIDRFWKDSNAVNLKIEELKELMD